MDTEYNNSIYATLESFFHIGLVFKCYLGYVEQGWEISNLGAGMAFHLFGHCDASTRAQLLFSR